MRLMFDNVGESRSCYHDATFNLRNALSPIRVSPTEMSDEFFLFILEIEKNEGLLLVSRNIRYKINDKNGWD